MFYERLNHFKTFLMFTGLRSLIKVPEFLNQMFILTIVYKCMLQLLLIEMVNQSQTVNSTDTNNIF